MRIAIIITATKAIDNIIIATINPVPSPLFFNSLTSTELLPPSTDSAPSFESSDVYTSIDTEYYYPFLINDLSIIEDFIYSLLSQDDVKSSILYVLLVI
jgi:hypothetical protein